MICLFFLILLTSIPSSSSFYNPFLTLSKNTKITKTTTTLHGGTGKTSSYQWNEMQHEIELTVRVPPNTRGSDVDFVVKPFGINLTSGGFMLLDGSRKMRGMIDVDGTYWTIADPDDWKKKKEGDDDADAFMSLSKKRRSNVPYREITVTIAKVKPKSRDEFDVVDYDWGGIYADDDAGEVLERKYDEPEELDVREYARELGIDLNDLDMNLVDKSMFSGGKEGLNLTRSGLDDLIKRGLAKEITRQGDGLEYTTDGEGNAVPFDNVPEMFRNSVSAEDALSSFVDGEGEQTRNDKKEDELRNDEKGDASDPIDMLTVKRLKEILREQNLKVSGNKQVLRDRLRAHINSVMVGASPQENK